NGSQVHKMVRYSKDEGPINVVWGHDETLGGYFLAVVDSRLAWQSEATEDVNEICEDISEDGGGSYFDLNTYRTGGFGRKVTEKTIFVFMKRYGIDPTTIKADR
ncbi:hypothetical protein BGZ99_002146, partial [Dissophora globulifera]